MPDQKSVDVWRVELPLPGKQGSYLEVATCDTLPATMAVIQAMLGSGEKAPSELRITRGKDMRVT